MRLLTSVGRGPRAANVGVRLLGLLPRSAGSWPRQLASWVLVLGVPAAAAAQQPPVRFQQPPSWDGPPLALADAIREAQDGNADLVAARAQVQPLAERPALERTLMPPRLEAQIWQWPLTTINPANVDSYMFMIEQEYPGPGKRELRAASAERELATASAEVNVRRLAVSGDVRRAYAALALARRDLITAYENGRALDALVEAAQVTYAAGGGSQAAVIRALLEGTRIEERAALLTAEERMAAARLNTLLGRAPGEPIGVLDEPRADASLIPAADAERVALDRHPEVLAARAAVEQAHAALAVARQERRPDWMVQGGYMLMPGEAGAWTAKVGLTWPAAPWAKTRLSAAIAEATRRRDATLASVAAVEARVRLMVAEARARLDAARARLQVLRGGLVPQAQHLVEATRVAFENAQGNLAEALDARLTLLDVQLDEARAVREVELAMADLDTALGNASVTDNDN